jgi:formylglycine-generating enzyme required for sulfatase activity
MSKKTGVLVVVGLMMAAGAGGWELVAQTAPAAQSDVKVEIPGMALIPAGSYWMGRTHMLLFDELSWVARDRLDDQPAHVVDLDAFYMDKYEVTQSEYLKFAEATGRKKPWDWKDGKVLEGREKWPIYNVSWEDAVAYCTWAGKRLPSEAEWEKAARGGLDRKLYSWGDDVGESRRQGENAANNNPYATAGPLKKAHYGEATPTAVGTYPPNEYGLYDVTGNVWEWVSDWYGRDYYASQPFDKPSRNPQGPETGKYRVLRGGGYSNAGGNPSDQTLMGVHYRNYAPVDQISIVYGFRCAKTAEGGGPQK